MKKSEILVKLTMSISLKSCDFHVICNWIILQVNFKLHRVQMKNSACVRCVHLLNSHLEAPFYRYNLNVHRRAKKHSRTVLVTPRFLYQKIIA